MADESTEGTCDDLYNQKIPHSRVDYVREEYKRYKRKKPPPDLSEVIDFQDPSTFRERVEKVELNESKHNISKFGLRCVSEWRVYELKTCPGFIFIVNPFLPGTQHYWTRRCMEDFPRKPNVCNLDAHVKLDPEKSVWELSHGSDENSDLMDRLRWVHLGYHFDYNVVDYKPERYYDFPSDLAGMTQHIANAIGYPDYSPEAGIVNYYPLGGSMGGHTDHYESDLSWPLISLSFGQTAIFLIGGATRDIRPVALYIRSGDIVVMSGKSRTAFHAVPRIVKVGNENEPPSCLKWKDGLFTNDVTLSSDSDETSIPDENVKLPDVFEKKTVVSQRTCAYNAERTEKPLFQESFDNKNTNKFGDIGSLGSEYTETSGGCQCNKNTFCCKSMKTVSSDEWRQFELYLSKTRINVNVRQVHEKGKTMKSFCL